MTDAQQIVDFVSRQVDSAERYLDAAASHIRDNWTPNNTLPIPAPTPRRLPPPTNLELAQRWMERNRALSAAIIAFAVTGSVGALIYVQQNRRRKGRRRAKKSASGARTDVVVVAGAVANPLTSALYLDLERRGFIVYVIANTSEEENYVRSQSRADLLPLHLDLLDPFTAQGQMARFHSLLAREHRAFDHAESHRLRFQGLILVPDTQTTPARIEEISSEEWSDALNARVLNTIATAQLFLPAVTEHKAKVLLLTPSVMPALKVPAHGVQSVVYGALEAFVSSLSAEAREDGVSVSHFKLGNIDIPSITAKQRRAGAAMPRLKATPLRKLQEAVFDALVAKRPSRTWHVGRGSLAYDIVGSWTPAVAVGWLMGSGTVKRPVEVPEESLQSSQGSLTWEKIEDPED